MILLMYPTGFDKLIAAFGKLPGIGPRAAERLTLYLFKRPPAERQSLIAALRGLDTLRRCLGCGNIADGELCVFCADKNRNRHLLCVVGEALDIIPIERTGSFDGLYYVLDGLLGGRENGRREAEIISPLLAKISAENIREVIIATDPTTEGDATALAIAAALKGKNVRVTRPARGLTTGADIEHVDELTLRAALENRRSLSA